MNKTNIFVAFFFVVCSATAQNKVTSFGVNINQDAAMSADEMSMEYQKMRSTDTVQTKFIGKVVEVCKMKGCWMKLALKDGEETMVRFKDYGFFMPKDIAGKEVVVHGLAFVAEMSVEDQKHYAKDAGESTELINRITAPKKTFSFEADGVLIK